jgi:hypothetical protein
LARPAKIRKNARDLSTRRGSLGPASCGRNSLAHDGPGHDVREEGDVHGEVEQRRRAQLAATDVDDVAQHPEGEERDADRQHNAQERKVRIEAEHAEEVDHRGHEEAVVLEPPEDAEVHGDGAERQEQH